jgi:F0F1-type ATP synthase alpha subunit
MSRDPTSEDPRALAAQIRHGAASPARDVEAGAVLSVRGPVARIGGLTRAMAGERVEIGVQEGPSTAGLVLELRRDHLVCAILGDASAVRPGDAVRRAGRLLDVPIGEPLRGRVVDALGAPLDGLGPIETDLRGRVDAKGPGLGRRAPLRGALHTGLKALSQIGLWKHVHMDLQDALTYHQTIAEVARMGPDLDKWSRAQLDRSERLVELMKQDANAPIPAEQQALVLYAGTRGLLDDLRLSDLRRFERELLALVASEHRGLLDDLAHQRIDAGLGDRIREAVLQLEKSFGA